MPQKVLFFLNNLHRTGSETLMFQYITELHKSETVQIGIVLMEKGGALVAELPPKIPVFYLDKKFNVFDKIAFHAGIDVIEKRINTIQKNFNASIWYFNTIAHIDLLRFKPSHSVQAWVHVHELLYNFESLATSEFELLLHQTDHLIACSNLAKELFVPYYNKPISVVNSTINPDLFSPKLKLNKPKQTKIKVVSAGTICYRKGTDLFLELASIAPKDEFEFIWLGSPAKNAFAELIHQKNNCTNAVKFLETPSDEEYKNQFAQADIFLSTSREESMGLVMLEAAALQIPILALNSGGATLIVNKNNGVICNDFRPTALLNELTQLAKRLSDFKEYPSLPFDYKEELHKFIALFNRETF